MKLKNYLIPLSEKEKIEAKEILDDIVGLQASLPDAAEYFDPEDLELAIRYEFAQYKSKVDSFKACGLYEDALLTQISLWYSNHELFFATKEALCEYVHRIYESEHIAISAEEPTLVPHLVDLTVSRNITVCVWADKDAEDWVVEDMAADMYRDGLIDLEFADSSTQAERTGEMPIQDAHCYQHFGENGRLTKDELSQIPSYQLLRAKEAICLFNKSQYGSEEADFTDLRKVAIAETTYEEGDDFHSSPYTVNVYVDLIGCTVETYIFDVLVSTYLLESLDDLCDNFLPGETWDSLVSIDPKKWTVYYYKKLEESYVKNVTPRERYVEAAKDLYPAGTKIRLLEMAKGKLPETKDLPIIAPGTEGSVDHVDDGGHIHMKWKNGSTLSLIPGVDRFVEI